MTVVGIFMKFKDFLKAKSTLIFPKDKKYGVIIFWPFLVFFVLITSIGYLFGPVRILGKPANYKWILIQPGTPAKFIGDRLKKEGLIRSTEAFRFYLFFTGKAKNIKAGSYFFNSSLSLPSIVKELEKGHPLTYRVTFPEGVTIAEVADILQKKGVISARDFKNQMADHEFLQKEFMDLNGGQTAEGYLFPDTYDFEHGVSAAEIAHTMAQRFRQVMGADIIEKAKEKNISLKKLITLASLVEKEARAEEERPVIAAVFLNRLQRGMRLESCASVQYVLGWHKEVLSYHDLEVDSPYNTYQHFGLPPAPISNPGLASIKAVLEPANVDYLYFVARTDGYHIFSKSYAQHQAAIRKLRRQGLR